MLKRVNGTGTMNWSMFDNARGFGSGLGVSDGKLLQANTTGNEQDDKTIVALSDGFQIADNGGTINDDGQSHIYIAIAKPTTRSMTQEEFNAEAVKMGTYNNRRDVHQGELAKEERADAARVLEDQYGVTPEMIGSNSLLQTNRRPPSAAGRRRRTKAPARRSPGSAGGLRSRWCRR